MILKLTLILFLTFILSQKSFSQNEYTKSTDINALVNMMEGSFSCEEQASNDSDYYDVRLHIKKIWPDNQDGKWLYVEQSVAQYPEKPYRQRICHITQTGNNSFESAVYFLTNPVRFAGAWSDTDLLNNITTDSLKEKEGCIVYISLIDDSTFSGKTADESCTSEASGAKYMTSEVMIRKNEIISWDRGFDETGRQVWGAEKGGYVFKRID